MYRTFNMGIGMVVIVSKEEASAIIQELETQGETVWQIGEVIVGKQDVKIKGIDQ